MSYKTEMFFSVWGWKPDIRSLLYNVHNIKGHSLNIYSHSVSLDTKVCGFGILNGLAWLKNGGFRCDTHHQME